MKKTKKSGPRILLIDIETCPMLSYNWGLFDQNISVDMIEQDWSILSFAAKWLDEKEIIYMDQSKVKNIHDDKKLLKKIWELMDEADFILGQNSNRFDIKKINARFLLNGFPPPSSYGKIDTKNIASKHFAFTSNKLVYLSENINKKYKKLDHKKFPGFKLWKECINGNKSAWKEMKDYNIYDVLALEELYHRLLPWDNTIDFNAFYEDKMERVCTCGSTKLEKMGYRVTRTGKYRRYRCLECGKTHSGKENLLSKEKREALRK